MNRRSSFRGLLLLAPLCFAACSRPESVPQLSRKIGENVTLTYWVPTWGGLTGSYPDRPGSLRIYEYLEEKTGVHVEFVYPPRNGEEKDLAIRVESGDLPDLIEWNWIYGYPDGPDQALADGVIINLNPLLRLYGPNLTRLLTEDVSLGQAITSEGGTVYGFPYLRLSENTRTSVGPVFRSAWLEETGQEIPETIDEWHSVLRAFRDYDHGTPGGGREYPFYLIKFTPFDADEPVVPFFTESNIFAGAFGTSHSFYWSGESLRFGPVDPEYEEMLTTLASWYAEGLIDPRLGDESRFTGYRLIEALAKCGSTIIDLENIPFLSPLKLVPAPPPILDRSRPSLGSIMVPRYGGERTVAVSAACLHPNEAVEWLDLGYGETGHLLYNFGIPGDTFTLRRGEPALLEEVEEDLITTGISGNLGRSILFSTSRTILGGPYVLDGSLAMLIGTAGFARADGAFDLWLQRGTEPPEAHLLSFSPLRQEYESLMAPIRRHVLENFIAFVSGGRAIQEFRDFQVEIGKMGLQRAYEILTSTRNRFLAKRVVF